METALHFCTSKNNIDVARKLIAHGASARVKDKRGQLALHRAAAIGSVPMIKLLLEYKSPLNATDVAGYTALHHGMRSLNFQGPQLIVIKLFRRDMVIPPFVY